MEKPLLLHIETATDVCSVALSEKDQLIGIQEETNGNTHSKNLLPFIDRLMSKTGRNMKDLDGVVVSMGPGSYTGLRIGVSTAKGIAYAMQIPIIAVNTLESIANGCRQQGISEDAQIVPMIDARRMEVFTARYDTFLNQLVETQSLIVDEGSCLDFRTDQTLYFCGNGMPKCKALLSLNTNAVFSEFDLSAQFMIPIALKKWMNKDFANTAYAEPFYLKEYVAGKPNVKGLHVS